MKSKASTRGLVYSTESGRLCPACGKGQAQCICRSKKQANVTQGDGIVRVGRETKGRKGKGVTIVRGLSLGDEQLRELAGRLKKRCAGGGAVKDGVIEIQGDHRETVIAMLQQEGYTVKRSGG